MDSQQDTALDQFFIKEQTRAYKMAYAMIQNREDALELVQDSMMVLVQKYRDKHADQWILLFYRILQNKIKDKFRQSNFRNLFHVFLPASQNCEKLSNPIQSIADEHQQNPQQELEQNDSLQQIITALKTLPLRQQQTFLMRAWQEFSVRETAYTLNISEGSVKTHYSRAINHLRETLGDSDV